MNGQVANGSGVTFSVAGNCAAIKSGLYQQNGADIGNNYPVSGSGGTSGNGDAGTFSTSKATYQVIVGPTGINGISGYVVDYKVTITSLAVGETGGADSFTMYYAPGSDTNSNIYGNATTPFTVNITNLPANIVAPTISAAFSPTSIPSGSSATLTLTINNPNSGFALTGVAVAASALPAGLSGSGAATSCSGGTATLAGSSLSLSGATVNASTSCTVTLTVSSPTPGSYSYTTGIVSATGPGSVSGSTATTPTPLSVVGPTATQSIASKTLTQNTAATSFTPVTGSGGAAPLTYGVSPSLPAGLSFNTSSGAITGTPTVTSGATTYTVTVTDANSATASNTFSLTVNGAVTATQSVASKTLTQNAAATSFTPVTGGGGTPSYTYSVSPSLPSGLTLSGSTGAITGTPTAVSGSQTYTITVTDANSATASNTFTLAVNGAVTATQSVASKTLTRNAAATSFTPVTGSGGTPSLTYSVSPSLPAGLALSTSTGAITGTPTVTSGASTYTITVTDANNATASNTFSLTVNSAVTATQSISAATVTVNTAITSFTPITGGGGTSPLSYGISPTLPAGLSFNTSTGQVSGTPTAVSSTTTYTVTVTDANNGTASNTFQLTVNGPLSATQAIASKAVTQNAAVTSFTPVTALGGTPSYTYSISPSLPTGLALSTSSGAITGTPTVTSGATTYTVTVTDANSATASNTFSLTVNSAVTATQAIASKVVTANHAVTAFTPVTGGGGTTPYTYSVSPSLPAGLAINSSTGSISGTPTTASGATTYTVTVTDAANATATNTFSLTVSGSVAATTAVPSTTLPYNQPATPFTPVTGSGGTGALTYAVSPTLPTGLSFNTSNGQISGTPTVPTPATTFTVTVTDTNSATASSTFSLTVNGPVAATTAVPSTTLPINQAVTPFAPITGSGGTGALTYAVSPGLPTGLSFNTSNGQISGTPTATTAAATYTVTVTDSVSATASATFSLSVGQLSTQVTLTSSQNPSQFGQAVTFTATVAPQNGGGTPAGTVTFNDNGSPIGTATLASGAATLTTTTLSVGSHTITATYGGSALFLASTSSGLAQTVNVPVDSVRLRSLQQTVSKMVAQNSGQAISGAIDDAIADGFSDGGGQFLTPGSTRMRFNFSADPRDQDERPAVSDRAGSGTDAYSSVPPGAPQRGRAVNRNRVDDAFAAIDRGDKKQAAPKWHEQKEWLLWADVRGTGVDRFGTTSTFGVTQSSQASLYGQQLNATMGLTYRATPSVLVGVLGGYETFSYTQQDINGKLKGDGWTTGAYLGWKIVPTLRFDAAVAYSGIGYNGSAGTAQGNFTGQRWMLSSGLTGNYKLAGVVLEPSTKVYALWEHQNAYTDSLGTRQGSYDFASGRASSGLRAAYPVAWLDSGLLLTPFLGMYGDYYFNKEDANALVAGALASTPLLQGWSARFTGGLGIETAGGAGLGLGAEYGGIGGNTRVWTFSAKARVPFSAR
ncbi:putative Ig domain-containing protein [Bradyrhizobium sp. HKCCYLS3077]|uniref:putative Ig domain-containing protein n=1 Tax=Bradyrhizobium sp. HKCCYLS3077 TaxID=3420761 RepID=UPI003EBCAD03